MAFDPDGIRLVVLDADGVLVHGGKPHPGAAELLDWLRSTGRQLCVLTNNSSASRAAYVRRWRRIGFNISRCEVVNSAYLTALYVKSARRGCLWPQLCRRRLHIFVVGGPGIAAEFAATSVPATLTRRPEDPRQPDAVIVGLDRNLTYAKIARAQQAIRDEGALFIATNRDVTYPAETRLMPGAGSIVASIATAAEREPDVVIGKPNKLAMDLILEQSKLKPSQTIVVGDRLETDIVLGRRAGTRTVLVLSGTTTRRRLAEIKDPELMPDVVIRDVTGLKKLLS